MNDDDSDFKPSHSTSSNLNSLFDTNKPHPSDNQTLTYIAPKPPRAGENSSTHSRGSNAKNLGTEKLQIFVSKNVRLYKLENEKYIGQGPAGAAIIGRHDRQMYQIILYKNNKEYLSKTYLQYNFIFTVLENNYASFYDTGGQNWSILFPSSLDVEQFSKQVAIAKYNSQKKKEKIITQDLMPPEVTKVNKKDIVNLEYCCYLLNNDDIVSFKEKSNWSVEISDNYKFPWQEGLKECCSKSKRVVIVPYSLSAPWMDEIQQNSSVIVEFEVISIRSTKHLDQNKIEPIKPKTLDESSTDASAEENKCNLKQELLKESIVLPRPQKVELISRIAKMGQALPLKVAFTCENEDLSSYRQGNDQGMINDFQSCSPKPMDAQQYMLSTDFSITHGSDLPVQHQEMRGGMNFPYQELHSIKSGPNCLSGQSNSRGMESVSTDAELRITINKVSQKVDHVLSKLQNFDATNWDKIKANQSTAILDPVSVINSIQDVMAENENLRAEIQQQKTKINEQDIKLHSLMELTQRCVERCAYPKPVVTADKIGGLGERPNTSNQLMTEMNMRMNLLSSEIEKYRREASENEQQVKRYHVEINDLVEKLKEKEKIIRHMEVELIQTTAENESLISVNEQQKRDIQLFERHELGEKRAEVQPVSEHLMEEIKRVMNAVNRKFQSYFDSDRSYYGKDIKTAIASTLKDVTIEYLKFRTKQKTRSDSWTASRRIIQVHSGCRSNEDTVEVANLKNEKSRTACEMGTVSPQKMVMADKQISQSLASMCDKPVEELEKSVFRLAEESSVHITTKTISGSNGKPDSLLTPSYSSLNHYMKNVEPFSALSPEYDTNGTSGVERKSSQMAGFSNRSTTMKSSAEEQNEEIVNHLDETTIKSIVTSMVTLPIPAEASITQSLPNSSTSVSSCFPRRTDMSSIRYTSIMSREQESLLKYQEYQESGEISENIEIEETKGSSTLNRTEQSSKADQKLKKESGNKTGSETVLEEETFVFVAEESPDKINRNGPKLSQKAKIPSALVKSTPLGTETSESKHNQNGGRISEESFVVIGDEGATPISRMSSETVIHHESGTGSASQDSPKLLKQLPSKDVGFTKINVLGAEKIQEGGNSSFKAKEKFRERSICTIESSTHPESNLISPTNEGKAGDVRKSMSERGLSSKMESLGIKVEDGSIVITGMDQSTSTPINPSRMTKDASKQAPLEKSVPVISSSNYDSSLLVGSYARKSQGDNRDNNNVKRDTKSKEKKQFSIEKEYAEKNSMNEEWNPSSSDERNKSSRSDARNQSLLYSDYFQGWESSKPPPLPTEDDDGSSETDEQQWL